MDQDFVKAHARVLFGYALSHSFAILAQAYNKRNALQRYKEEKKKLEAQGADVKGMRFNRYTDESLGLIPGDRAIANFVEWSPAFLSLFLANASIGQNCSTLGWAYVGLRFVYPVLALNGGITSSGAKPLIFLATVPMYAILVTLVTNFIKHGF